MCTIVLVVVFMRFSFSPLSLNAQEPQQTQQKPVVISIGAE
jgi:hypothetical protein